MMIHYKKLNLKNEQHLSALLKWENDESIHHLITPIKDRNQKFVPMDIDQLKTQCSLKKDEGKHLYLVYDQDQPIGQFSIHIDPAHLYKKVNHSSWLGLCIGEKKYWGTGAGQEAMKFFERESIKLGLKRAELGVFEFNFRAIQFYKNLGYQIIGELENFTYWNDRYWCDIRMEKYLYNELIN